MLRLVLICAWLLRGSTVSGWQVRTQIAVLGGISHPFLLASNSSVNSLYSIMTNEFES